MHSKRDRRLGTICKSKSVPIATLSTRVSRRCWIQAVALISSASATRNNRGSNLVRSGNPCRLHHDTAQCPIRFSRLVDRRDLKKRCFVHLFFCFEGRFRLPNLFIGPKAVGLPANELSIRNSGLIHDRSRVTLPPRCMPLVPGGVVGP